ncbi:N-acetylmuramoyl-L-alanine amidase [Shimia thalassica]|uniref:N-acetylmuramoyl-L-alanine amidase n=2 Tax=Shimia thalassica TaxID=1715693 RepID=UPI0026E27BA8|nr:N-acetylmuramoyl-L-alanine amidase [Shimia thalassica]
MKTGPKVAMSRLVAVLVSFWLAGMAAAQDFSGLARVDGQASQLTQERRGTVTLDLALSQGVPWRVFQLDTPKRLVLDFREIDWTGFSAQDLGSVEGVQEIRFGQFRPGWSRMILLLDAPLAVARAGMVVNEETGSAGLNIELRPVDAETYAEGTGAPNDPRWDLPEPTVPAGQGREDRPAWAPVVIVLDPGHGGIDPGAQRGGVLEKDLMLQFAREIRDTLRRSGNFEVILTRDDDVFVSLERRVSIAHEVQADLFISLHADALQQGHASGATVYVLADEASDKASAILAQRHDRADILAGIDLTGAEDEVADVLLDLARLETQPRTQLLATSLVEALDEAAGPLNRKPLREAGFSVLKAADVPSVLIEVGFLSSDRDFALLQDPNWRAAVAGGLRDGLQLWIGEDKVLRDLVRQ